jgi:hypothetical protein
VEKFEESNQEASAMKRFLLLLICLLVAGCTTYRQSPLTVNQVVEMSKAGVPPSQIIAEMRDSHTVYPVKASQLARLHEMGVPDEVIDYMQSTYIASARRQQNMEDWYYWTPYGPFVSR